MIGRALIPLLVVALLLCHGAFGPDEQILPTGSSPVVGHLTLAGSAAEQGGAADSEDPNHYYYTAALLLVVGALFWARPQGPHPGTPGPIVWAPGGRLRDAALGRSHVRTVILLRVLRL